MSLGATRSTGQAYAHAGVMYMFCDVIIHGLASALMHISRSSFALTIHTSQHASKTAPSV